MNIQELKTKGWVSIDGRDQLFANRQRIAHMARSLGKKYWTCVIRETLYGGIGNKEEQLGEIYKEISFREKLSGIKSFLKTISDIGSKYHKFNKKHFKYCSVDELLYKQGKAFKPGKLPQTITLQKPRECFKNCLLLASAMPQYRYAEGYAMNQIPLAHAWLVDKEGLAIDPTWPEPSEAYFGITIDTEYAVSASLKRGKAGCLDDPENAWPLLRHGVSVINV